MSNTFRIHLEDGREFTLVAESVVDAVNRYWTLNPDDETKITKVTRTEGFDVHDVTHEFDDGGIIAKVHEGEAVIPLDTSEGQEALADAVEEVASEAIEEAATEAIEDAVDVSVAATELAAEAVQEVISTELRAAMRQEFTQFINDLAALQVLNGQHTEPEPAIDELPASVVEDDVPPEPTHWFFSPIRRNRVGS